MNILLVYGDEPGTFGRYWKRVLKKENTVITCGPNSSKREPQDIKIKEGIIDIQKVIKKIKPEEQPELIIQIDSPFNIFLTNLDKVKAKTVLFWTDVTIKLPILRHYAANFDYLFTFCKAFVPILKSTGLTRPFYLPFAIDPLTHKDYKLPRSIDVGFVGHLSTIYNPKRTFYLKYLDGKVPLTIKTDIYENDMSKFYSRCKIVFNLSVTKGINMRSFEALGTGALLIQNASCTDITKCFVDRKDLVLYNSPQEAVKLIKYYLKHPKERRMIAREGQKKVFKYHLYQQRAAEFIKIIKQHKPQKKSAKEISKNLGKVFFLAGSSNNRQFSTKPILEKIMPKVIHPLLRGSIKQIETFQFKWSIPFWYFALLSLKIRSKLELLICKLYYLKKLKFLG